MLHTLKPATGSRRKAKRIARGDSAGGGSTAGRGNKGQQSRTGKGRRFGFEGGQTPLIRRQPKLGGFTHPRRQDNEVLDIASLADLPAGTYDIADLRARHLVRTKRPVKLLGKGEVKAKLVLTVNSASKSAKSAIEAAGGAVHFTRA